MARLIQEQTILGDKRKIGNQVITPQAQSITLRWPYGGMIWKRPVAVVVEQDNQTTRIPIIDVTRILVWGFLGLGLIFAIVTALLTNKQRRKKHE